MGLEQFKTRLSNTEAIKKGFTVLALRIILRLHFEKTTYIKLLKPALVNLVSGLYGDSSVIAAAKKTPHTLKHIVKNSIKNWKIEYVNVAFAVAKFPEELSKWNDKNPFKGNCTVKTDSGSCFHICQCYAQLSVIIIIIIINLLLLSATSDPRHITGNMSVAEMPLALYNNLLRST